MIKSWVIYWFIAVVIYILGKALRNQKIGTLPLSIVANIIAIIFGGMATYLMLQTR